MLHLAGEDVPHDDGEVHAARDQGALVVARGHLVGVQHARHLVAMATQGAVGRPAWSGERKRGGGGGGPGGGGGGEGGGGG